MDELFEKFKNGAGKLRKGAEKVTKQVVRKTNDAVSQTKLNFAINETESKISEIYEEMGRNVYRKYLKTEEVCDSMKESCAQIDKLFTEIDDLKEKIAELKHSVKCPKCGDYNKNGASYCSTCGTELKSEAEDVEEYAEEDEAEDEPEEEIKQEIPKKVVTIRARKPVSQED